MELDKKGSSNFEDQIKKSEISAKNMPKSEIKKDLGQALREGASSSKSN